MTLISEGMPRKPSENTTQIALRVPDAWLEQCDAMIPWLSRPGIAVTRTDIIRAAIARGIEALQVDRAADEQARRNTEKEKRGGKVQLAEALLAQRPSRARR